MGWECLFFHRELQVFLSVYVDDFKLAGKTQNLPIAWKRMTDAGLILDPPEPLGRYLGCGQKRISPSQEEVNRRMEHIRPAYDSMGYALDKKSEGLL